MDAKKAVFDFVSGEITYKEFETMMFQSDEIFEWLQSIIDASNTDAGKESFDVRKHVLHYEFYDKRGSIGYQLNLHGWLKGVIKYNFPDADITVDNSIKELFNLFLDFVPSYIGGCEAEPPLEEIFLSVPDDLPKTKRKAIISQKIKETFHIEGKNYPHWIQEPEWPVSNGKPMKFVKTVKVNSEMRHHYFVDVDTGEERIVEDFH